jgi:membrane-associated phospholipid phosphatase
VSSDSSGGPARSQRSPSAAEHATGWRSRLLVEVRYRTPLERRRDYRRAAALIVTGIVLFDALLIGVVTRTGLQRLDAPVERWFQAEREADRTPVMTVLAYLFGPVGMPVVVVIALVTWILLARHLWRPLLLLAGMVAGVVLAQVLAPLVRHPRPPVDRMLLEPDYTFSFPSGHVLGMADFFLLTAYLLASRIRRRWVTVSLTCLAVAAVLGQIVSRLYLGYHWLTDVSASVALSLVIVGVVIVIDTRRTVRVPGEPVGERHSVRQTEGT